MLVWLFLSTIISPTKPVLTPISTKPKPLVFGTLPVANITWFDTIFLLLFRVTDKASLVFEIEVISVSVRTLILLFMYSSLINLDIS